MYMGPSTEEPPMPSPPTNRKNTSEYQSQAKAHPRAETTYRTAMMRRLSRRPKRSAGIPANMAPRMVPISAVATVRPREKGESRKTSARACVAPEMTTVSKPNSRPPRAATTVLRRRQALSFIGSEFVRGRAAWSRLRLRTANASSDYRPRASARSVHFACPRRAWSLAFAQSHTM